MVGSTHLKLGQGPGDRWTFWEICLKGRRGQQGRRNGELYTDSFIQSVTTQERLHLKVGILDGRVSLGSPTSLLGAPSCRAGATDAALDLTLLQDLLHGIGQGEVPVTALRQADPPGPSSTAPVRLCPQIPQGARGRWTAAR